MSEVTLRSRGRDQQIQTVEYKVADSPTERRDAFRLVYDQYIAAGLMPPNRHRVRVTPFHLLPTTQVFVAYERGGIVATMSLVGDGGLGLPMESIYGDEVMRRRRDGLRISEVSCLADRLPDRHHFLSVFCGLSRVLAQFARRQGYHQLLVVCHPRHSAFYRRYLGFELIGSVSHCPHVQNHPAVPLCLDFDFVDRHPPACYPRFFGDWLPPERLRPSRMAPLERAVLRRMIDHAYGAPAVAFAPDVPDGESVEMLASV